MRGGRRSDDGFSLVELLLVIGVLGLLAGTTVWQVKVAPGQGARTLCRSTVREVRGAIERYFADRGSYPDGQAAAVAAAVVPGDIESLGDGAPVDSGAPIPAPYQFVLVIDDSALGDTSNRPTIAGRYGDIGTLGAAC